MENNEVMLSTIDNPFDYFTQFKEWNLFDVENGYNSCSYLARVAQLSDDMSQSEIDTEIERAIDEIIKYDFRDVFIKVHKTSTK